MTKRSLYARRLITLVGVVAALTIGFGSIQAAALWTAASAPLTVAPVSVATLQSQLADERNRSTAVVQQLAALESQSMDLAAALQAAHAQIDTETTHAANLAAQLKAAKERLAKLEATIKAANKAARARAAAAAATKVTTVSAPGPASGGEHDEPEPGDDGR
jgi:DNA repair exonuclease SbcCD ATPase subunit